MLDEAGDVLLALAQRRHEDADDVQTIVEVLAEVAAGDLVFEHAIGRHHHPGIRPQRALAADAVVLLVLQDLEQLGLERRVHLADLVEEDGPLVGELELARLLAGRSRERAALVAEQLGFEQLARQRRAVDLHERFSAPGRALVYGASDALLAHAALAADEHRYVSLRHPIDHVPDRQHRRAGGDVLRRDAAAGGVAAHLGDHCGRLHRPDGRDDGSGLRLFQRRWPR